jgi:hypothetical protein
MSAAAVFASNVQIVLSAGAAIAVVAAIYFWRRNAPNRKAIKKALRVTLPEQSVEWYDAAYLERFMAAARNSPVNGAASALALYRRPTLLWNDVWLGVSIGAALVLGNLAIAFNAPLQPFGEGLAVVCAAMGALYSVFGALEDITFDEVFGRGVPVAAPSAFRASFLTHAKFASFYFSLPALVGVAARFLHDHAPSVLYYPLYLAPLVLLLAACVAPTLARVLWACRISLVSALLGYFLFLLVIQAQDLFADTTFGPTHWVKHVVYWASFFAAVALVWALPVHYAARDALEGPWRAEYVADCGPELVRWAPRVLGLIPVVAVLLGVFGAAVETRGATRLESDLDLQYVLLAVGGWFTLGFVLLVMVERRTLVARFLNGSESGQARALTAACALVTFLFFLWLFFAPLSATTWIVRAALVPFLLGSGVLFFGLLSRFSDRSRRPIVGFAVALALALTAANGRFNDVRRLDGKDQTPVQISLVDAVGQWEDANHCRDAPADCPPALLIAADGGASRAAYFTAVTVGKLLDSLTAGDECGDPTNPARCIFAMSGVSGGSVGLVAAKAALLDSQDAQNPRDAPLRAPCDDSERWSDCLPELVAGDYLSVGFVGLAFRDQFAPPFWPFTDSTHWGDRAALLEKSWERAFLSKTKRIAGAAATCEAQDKKTGFCRPFAQPSARWTPLLLLNGTSIQTGRRVITSELAPIWLDDERKPRRLHQWAYDLFEILGAPCDDPESDACASNAASDWRPSRNVRLSTAALLSARFPFISPAGTIRMSALDTDAKPGPRDSQFGDEVVDGGYFENSGLTTAREVAAALKAKGLMPVVLSISNDPTFETTKKETLAERSPTPNVMHLPVGPAATNSILVRAIDILYAPIATLYRSRDSHAEIAGQNLAERLQEWDVPAGDLHGLDDCYAPFFPIRVYQQGHGFDMPQYSMSWWLSPVVRKALENQFYPEGIHSENAKQMALLHARLSREGCLACQLPKVSRQEDDAAAPSSRPCPA